MNNQTTATYSTNDPAGQVPPGGPNLLGGKFLTFFLAGEEYGLEILKVQEIIGLMAITPVPGTPPYLLGVINLRGKLIPVLDIRLKFGIEAQESRKENCIIVVEVQSHKVGVVVDSVSEVLDIAPEDVEAAPSFGSQVDTSFIMGVGKTDDKVRLLLDIDRVLSSTDLVQVQAAGEGQKPEKVEKGASAKKTTD